MGCLNLSGDVAFTTTLDAKMKKPNRTVKDIRKEWKGYNEKAHAREAVSRWGGCFGRYEDDKGGSGSDGSDDLHKRHVDHAHPRV